MSRLVDSLLPEEGAPERPAWRAARAAVSAAVLAYVAFVPASIAGTQITFGIALALLLALTLARERGLRLGHYDGAMLLHVATVALSLAFTWLSDPPNEERFDPWRLLALITLTSAFLGDRRLVRRALQVLVLSGTLMGLYGVLQHYTGVDWVRGSDSPLVYASMFSKDRFRPTGVYRAYPTFAFALAFVLTVAVTAGLELFRGWRRRALLAAACLPMLMALAFTEVRAAWAGLFLGLLVAAWLRSRRAVLGVAGAGVLVFAILLLSFPLVREKAAKTFDLGFKSNSHRVFMWVRALEMAGDRPAVGVGYGHFDPATQWYYDRFDATSPVRCHAHNNYLHFWAVAGPLGLTAFLWLFVVFLRAAVPAYRRARELEDPLAAAAALGAVATVVTFLVGALAQDPYFNGEIFYALVVALALGAAAAHWTGARPAPQRWSLADLAGVGLPVGVSLLVGATQSRWDPELGLAGVALGPGSALRLAGLCAGGCVLLLLMSGHQRRRRLLADDFTVALLLSGVVVLFGYLWVTEVFVRLTRLSHHAGAWAPAMALAQLGAALGTRALWRARPSPRRAVAWLAVPAAAALVGALLRPGPLAPLELPEASPWVGRYRASGGAECAAAVVSGRGIVTSAACAGGGRGVFEIAGLRVDCLQTADRSASRDAVSIRCRPPGEGRSLLDAVGVAWPPADRGYEAFGLPDRDADGVPDGVDDCAHHNPSQTDSDRDGIGDACEPLASAAALPEGAGLAVGTANGEVHRLELSAHDGPLSLRPTGERHRHLRAWSFDVLAAADLDGDGIVETAGAAENSGRLIVWHWDGTEVAHRAMGWHRRWAGLAAGRFAGAGEPALLVTATNYDRRLTFLELGPGELIELAGHRDVAAGELDALGAGDLDGDGADELVVARSPDEGPTRIEVYAVDRKSRRVVRPRPAGLLPDDGRPPVSALVVLPPRADEGARALLFHADGRLRTVAFGAGGPQVTAESAYPVAGLEVGVAWAVAVPSADGMAVLAYGHLDPMPIEVPLDSLAPVEPADATP